MSSTHITIKNKHIMQKQTMKYEKKMTITMHNIVNDAKKLV